MQDGGLENPASLDGSAPRGFAADRSWLATADAWVRYLSEIPAVVILVALVLLSLSRARHWAYVVGEFFSQLLSR